MKQITKDILKKTNKVLLTGLITFCWLMACVGITAYAVYWLRQNANNVQEVNNQELHSRVLKPKLSYADNDTVYYNMYSEAHYETNSFGRTLKNTFINSTGTYNVYGSFYDNNDVAYSNMRVTVSLYSISASETGLMLSVNLANSSSNYVITSSVISGNYGVDYTVNFGVFSYFYWVGSLSPESSFLQSGISIYNFIDFVYDVVYSPDDTTSFDFNEMPNYNQLMSYQLFNTNVFQYNGQSPITPLDIYYHVNLTFISNGVLFDQVTFNASAVAWTSDSNGNVTQYDSIWSGASSTFKLSITSIEYRYYGTNRSITVASLGVLEYRTNYNNQTVASTPVWLSHNPFNWVDTSFKYLSIYNPTKDIATSVSIPTYILPASCPFLNLTSYDALTFNTSVNIIGASVTDIGLSNVFTLMNSAFTGLAGLMAIQILPNLTLGVLVFIPLILTIILVVLKLVKK